MVKKTEFKNKLKQDEQFDTQPKKIEQEVSRANIAFQNQSEMLNDKLEEEGVGHNCGCAMQSGGYLY